jgi:hypothetical protein
MQYPINSQQAFEKVGENGSTVVEESQTLVDEVEFTEGLTVDRGYLSPYFVNDNERQVRQHTALATARCFASALLVKVRSAANNGVTIFFTHVLVCCCKRLC